MIVFDDIERPGVEAHPYGESDFVYTNRSGREEAKKVRALIEDWLTRYPEDDRPSLVQRLRSPIDTAHRGAFLELLLHELFLRRGHNVIDFEPEIPGTTKKPDFLMETPKGERYYLEAVLARGLTKEAQGAEQRLNSALNAIDSTSSPDHFLDLRTNGTPRTPVPINRLQRALKQWIAALPEGNAARTAAPFKYTHDGLEIVLTAWPKHRSGVTRSIGARHFGASNVMRAESMKDAVEFKARKYGKALRYPMLVAVAGYDNFNFDTDAIDVLLGTEIPVVHKDDEGKPVVRHGRKPDGVWHDGTGPRRRVLSGVLWFKQIDPWNFAARAPIIIANPWADRAMPRLDVGLRELHISEQGEMEYPGGTLGQALALPDNWPEDT